MAAGQATLTRMHSGCAAQPKPVLKDGKHPHNRIRDVYVDGRQSRYSKTYPASTEAAMRKRARLSSAGLVCEVDPSSASLLSVVVVDADGDDCVDYDDAQ